MSYDSIIKYLIEEFSQPIISWLLKEDIQQKPEILTNELNVEPIRADGVFFLKVSNKIIHLEFQTVHQSNPPLPLRMFDYAARLYRLYPDNIIEQILVFLKPTTSNEVFVNEFKKPSTIHRYQVVRIWEYDSNLLLDKPELLPLAVLAKTDNPKTLLKEVSKKINIIENRRLKSNISTCVQLLAGIKFKENLIKDFFREDMMKESVIYQSIINEGLEKGRKEGTKEGQLGIITSLLEGRFGNLDDQLSAIVQKIAKLPVSERTQLLLSLANLSREDLLQRFSSKE